MPAPALEHLFGHSERLICEKIGCEVDWWDHQENPQQCLGKYKNLRGRPALMRSPKGEPTVNEAINGKVVDAIANGHISRASIATYCQMDRHTIKKATERLRSRNVIGYKDGYFILDFGKAI